MLGVTVAGGVEITTSLLGISESSVLTGILVDEDIPTDEFGEADGV